MLAGDASTRTRRAARSRADTCTAAHAIPGLSGRYVYADYCSGRLWTIRPGSKTPTEVTSVAEAAGLKSPSSFGEGSDGTLYLVAQGGGGVLYRFDRA